MRIHLLLAPCILLIASAALAEDSSAADIVYRSGDPSTWPKEKDAVIAAPKNHRILLDNESVRVLDVTVAPGELEPVHSHRWPSVLYVMKAGDFIDRDGEGKIVFDTRTLKAPLKLPLTMWKEPEAPHTVENLSKTTVLHLVRIELKK